jgi:hypothetical protein
LVSKPSPNVLSVRPLFDWQLGATYQVDLTGVLDLNGNESPAISWNFTIAADGVSDSTRLQHTSTVPMQGAVGVPPDAPIILEFSKPVYPVTNNYGYPPGVSISNASGSFRAIWDQSRVRMEPLTPLPSGRQITVQAQVGDAIGLSTSAYLTFFTAASQDTDPPRVESISPAPGSRLLAGQTDFLIRFNKPVQIGGDWAGFSFGGQSTPIPAGFPAQGDGRTLIASSSLPADIHGTLDLKSGITDLAGNALAPVSFEYFTATADESSWPQVKSMRPASDSRDVPLDAAIELRFTQQMNEGSLNAALLVTDDGYQVPVTLTTDDGGLTWHVVPSTPWRAGSVVTVEIANTAFSVSGLQLSSRFTGQFRTIASAANASPGPTVAALEASPGGVDIRFAAPLAAPPDEPFGLRKGPVRVPVVVEQLGTAWFRLTPASPLDPGEQYYLMAGPGMEIPLRIARDKHTDRITAAGSAPRAAVDASGRLYLRFSIPVHAFGIDHETLVLLDREGRPVPHEARVEADGQTIGIELFGQAPVRRIIWRGHEIVISR